MELGVEKTKASKARALHRTFPTEQAVEGLSVQHAYAHRKRKPRGPSPKKRHRRQQQPGLFDWLLDVCKKADLFLDEAGFTDPGESSTLLPAVDAAIDELTKLRERLQERTSAQQTPASHAPASPSPTRSSAVLTSRQTSQECEAEQAQISPAVPRPAGFHVRNHAV